MEKPDPIKEIQPVKEKRPIRNKSVEDILQGSDHFADCDRFYNHVYV